MVAHPFMKSRIYFAPMLVVFTISCVECNVESSEAQRSTVQASCASFSSNPMTDDFWNCDARQMLLASLDMAPKSIQVRLHGGEFSMTRNLGHLNDPEFEDLMIVTDALPGLVSIVCSELPNYPVEESTRMSIEAVTSYEASFPIRRVLNQDPDLYEWRADAVDVYRSLDVFCQ